jgi:hypothetical protein
MPAIKILALSKMPNIFLVGSFWGGEDWGDIASAVVAEGAEGTGLLLALATRLANVCADGVVEGVGFGLLLLGKEGKSAGGKGVNLQ